MSIVHIPIEPSDALKELATKLESTINRAEAVTERVEAAEQRMHTHADAVRTACESNAGHRKAINESLGRAAAITNGILDAISCAETRAMADLAAFERRMTERAIRELYDDFKLTIVPLYDKLTNVKAPTRTAQPFAFKPGKFYRDTNGQLFVCASIMVGENGKEPPHPVQCMAICTEPGGYNGARYFTRDGKSSHSGYTNLVCKEVTP